MKKRNPVAKYMNEFNKPRTFRNRKKQAKKGGDYRERPRHKPYKRERFDPEDDIMEAALERNTHTDSGASSILV